MHKVPEKIIFIKKALISSYTYLKQGRRFSEIKQLAELLIMDSFPNPLPSTFSA